MKQKIRSKQPHPHEASLPKPDQQSADKDRSVLGRQPLQGNVSPDLKPFEQTIDIRFKNQHLLRQVFVHRSYLNEHITFDLDHNERLEFLGDAVLELVVTEYLYITYPNPEGELTNWRSSIVKGEMLSKIAKEIGVNNHLMLSRGEQKSGGKARDLILANAFEALIGSIYLDQGYGVAQSFIHRFLLVHLEEIIEKRLYRDSKSLLQEWSQAKYNLTPIYKVLQESGPDHAKSFIVGVHLGERLISQGEGASKQRAEQQAASKAVEHFGVS